MAVFTISPVNGVSVLQYTKTEDEKENEIAADIAARFNAAPPGTYKTVLTAIQDKYGEDVIKKYIDKNSIDVINTFYKDKNITTKWDGSKQGLQPPIGEFDPKYYSSQVPEIQQKWKEAQSSVSFGGEKLPDVDITERYDADSYLHQHYTTSGKHSGIRANEAQALKAAAEYKESYIPTDAEKQEVRVALLYPDQGGESLVEKQTKKYVNEQGELVFGALVSDTLKQSLEEYKKAKWKETQTDFLSRMPEFSDVYNLSGNLSNSILGDTGIGGYLNLMGGSKAEEKIKEGLNKAIGMGNSMQYNWQKWFDETLTKRYETLATIESPENAEKTYQVDKAFAEKYINDYLKPRFNTSKSMSEFMSYLDVTEEEQNILQTQTVSNKLKELGDLRAETFINELQTKGVGRGFDSNFYFNAISPSRELNLQYAQQRNDVRSAWSAAKAAPNTIAVDGLTWEQVAYQYGVDLKDKDQFAKLHYEILGKDKGYDAGENRLQNQDLIDFLQKDLAPTLASAEKTYGSNVFLEFITPEQIADALLGEIDPVKTPEAWEKTLQQYGIKDTKQPIEEVKKLLMQTLSTVPAEAIRSSIEKLNKENKTPTQELLGIEYIQRPEDKKEVETKGETAIYNIFKGAGYQGTEDEFYTNFMPDLNRAEMELIGKQDPGKSDLYAGLTSKDPLEAMFSMDKLFDATSGEKKETPTKTTKSSYLTLLEDDTTPNKSAKGQEILDSFTSAFKGFF